MKQRVCERVTFPLFRFRVKRFSLFFSLVQVSAFPQAPFNFVARQLEGMKKKVSGVKGFSSFSSHVTHPVPFPFGATITRERKMPTWKKIKRTDFTKKLKPTKKKKNKKKKRFFRFFIFSSLSYPEGNFGGNQQLDGSMGLSPLYPSCTNDLHVSIETSFHQSFLWLHSTQA